MLKAISVHFLWNNNFEDRRLDSKVCTKGAGVLNAATERKYDETKILSIAEELCEKGEVEMYVRVTAL